MIRLSLVTTFAAAALLSLSTGGLAAVTNCGTAPKKILVAQSDAGQSTSSVNFVDVIGSEVNFNIPGADITGSTCVLMDFSAQASAPVSNAAMVPGSPAVFNAVELDAHAYNFLFENVRPGLHSVKMQYRSLLPGISVSIVRFDMVVHHK